uniref:Myocardial zonula adherens protein n=1 Tax=Nothoprocta perdicaria TaxID=30464 RepID=A0A8C6ZSF3_NOTPE
PGRLWSLLLWRSSKPAWMPLCATCCRCELYHVPNGMSAGKLSHGMVYGVVHRTDNNHQREMVVYGWSADQLKEEMNYIKEVRATLEKVRKKMYGEYDEMKRKIQQLTNELKVTNAHQESLENHVRVQAAALDSFSEMNSSLTSASIDLQKTLVDVTLENTDIREQIRNLKHTHEQSMEKLREKQKQLETAQIENQLLKLKVESSQEANAEVMREMTRKLYSQYEEKMREEEKKHKAEKEILLEETNRLLKAIEEANKKMQITETSIQEKDRRIGELDRLIERMEEERHQLQKQLELNEIQISGAKSENNSDSERSQHLEEVAASLRERIKHLDDMVHCQQKKVKHMVEEIEMLRKKVKEKELFIVQLLEKISFLECENKELQDKLDYLMENQPKTNIETRDTGVGCDLPFRYLVFLLVHSKSFHITKLTEKPVNTSRNDVNLGLSTITLEISKISAAINKSHTGSPASAARRGLGSEQQLPQDNAQGGAEGAGGSEHSKDLLADAFQKVSIADAGDSGGAAEREQSGAKHRGNVFGSLYAKTPHYIEVLESRAKNPIVKKNKFKTNIGTSSSQSPEGSGSLMTPEERRLRDKKHLNDITAARLPPLHHAPAKLLSIEESIAIQIQQKEAYEEMQAKLAAQKLAERLNIKMTRFEPEGEASMILHMQVMQKAAHYCLEMWDESLSTIFQG